MFDYCLLFIFHLIACVAYMLLFSLRLALEKSRIYDGYFNIVDIYKCTLDLHPSHS